MRIVVPIKQVPETGNVKMDPETGTIIREGNESIVNPLDLYAVEEALRLKEKHGGSVAVISMGPASAEKALKEAIAMGCDQAWLISDRKFAGSDTWATAHILACGFGHLGGYDLIIAGERATDGDTGQVGPNLAAALDLPLATFVRRIDASPDQGLMRVERLLEEGEELLELPLPALVTVVKEINFPRLPTLRGKKKARNLQIETLNAQTLGTDPSKIGLLGSPTRVVKMESPRVTRTGTLLKVKDEASLQEAASALMAFLKQKGFFSEGSHG